MLEEKISLMVDGVTLQGVVFKPEPEASRTKPWLVLLHEALGSIRLWRDVPRRLALATGLPTLVFERQGHGESKPLCLPRSLTYLEDEASKILPKVLNQLGIRSAFLFGHSDGGSIALLFAAEYPERVVGVISEAAHVFVEPETLNGIREAGQAYRDTALRSKLMRYHGEKTDALFSAWQDTWLSQGFRSWNMEDHLPSISAPVLVIQGEADRYGTPAQIGAIENGVAGICETLLVPACGHEPHREASDCVLPIIANFIKRFLPANEASSG